LTLRSCQILETLHYGVRSERMYENYSWLARFTGFRGTFFLTLM